MKKTISFVKALGHQTADKRIEVLRLIDQTGSISQAARDAGISYKSAWQAIHTLTNLAGMELVDKNVGGVGGGGARLTSAGQELLRIASVLEIKRQQYLRELAQETTISDEKALPPLGIQTSMRNYLPCQVKALTQKGLIILVQLVMRDGSLLVARITRASAELLDLKPGLNVIALCKAMAVKIDRECDIQKAPGDNLINGVVNCVTKGDGEDEVAITTASGIQLVGFALSDKALQENEKIVAKIDASTVVVALIP